MDRSGPLTPPAVKRPSLLVLNDDTVVCEDCHELNKPSGSEVEWDFGTFVFGHTDHGQCSSCGASVAGGPSADA